MALEYTLYASYLLDQKAAAAIGIKANLSDEELDALAEKHGFDRSHSGFGGGVRDMEWFRKTPLTAAEIEAVRADFRAQQDLIFARYCVENWSEEYTTENGDQLVEEFEFVDRFPDLEAIT